MYMRTLDEPLLMGTSSPEISFIGFGTCTSHDDIATDDEDCESLSLLAIDPVTETCPSNLWNWMKKGICITPYIITASEVITKEI